MKFAEYHTKDYETSHMERGIIGVYGIGSKDADGKIQASPFEVYLDGLKLATFDSQEATERYCQDIVAGRPIGACPLCGYLMGAETTVFGGKSMLFCRNCLQAAGTEADQAASTILCNAFSFSMLDLSMEGTIRYSPMTLAEARSHFLGFRLLESAVGHEATAQMLTGLLEQPVHFNRVSVKLDKGQDMVLFQWLGARLPEGKILQPDEIIPEDFQFVRVSVR